jgi:hypothetical protein
MGWVGTIILTFGCAADGRWDNVVRGRKKFAGK